jgi:YHS domain-containing protein
MKRLVIALMSTAALLVISTAAVAVMDCPQDMDKCCTKTGECPKTTKMSANTAVSKDPTKQDVVIDPVCGMDVDVKTAKYSYKYKDKTYYFCSKSCEKSFAKDPEKYIGKEQKKSK